MLTCLTIGDPHFKVSNVQDTKLMSKKIIEVAKEMKPDFIVCLGDILDRHETIHVIPLTESINFLNNLSKISPLYIIIGNHDRPNNSNFLTKEHPFLSLENWDNTYIADTIIEKEIKGRRFLYVPYVPPGRFMEALAHHFNILDKYKEITKELNEYRNNLLKENIKPEDLEKKFDSQQIIYYQNLFNDYLDKITTIFAHQEFRGAKMGAIISKEGDLWCSNWPYVISGHIHDYDQLSDNVLYTGTPIAHAFGDKDDKTISWVTWEENELSDKRIDLELPKKKILYMNTEDVLKYEPKDNDIHNHIKIVISGTSSEIKTVMKNKHINYLKNKGIKINYNIKPSKTIEEISQERKCQLDRLSYSQRLYRHIYKNPEMKEFFIENYGHIDETQIWKIAPKHHIVIKSKQK